MVDALRFIHPTYDLINRSKVCNHKVYNGVADISVYSSPAYSNKVYNYKVCSNAADSIAYNRNDCEVYDSNAYHIHQR